MRVAQVREVDARTLHLGGTEGVEVQRQLGVAQPAERDFFIDNLLVRIHLIIEMILVDRPCAMGV